MPHEDIGSCGNGEMPHDRDWIVRCYEMAIVYLRAVVGDPPGESKLEVIWHEHDSGCYPSLGLVWDTPWEAAPGEYIEECELALCRFDAAVDWEKIAPAGVGEDDDPDDGHGVVGLRCRRCGQ